MSNFDPQVAEEPAAAADMEAAMAAAPSLPKEPQGQLTPAEMQSLMADLRVALAKMRALLGQ